MLAKAAEDAPPPVCFGVLMQCLIQEADLVFKTSKKMLVLPFYILHDIFFSFPLPFQMSIRVRWSVRRRG